MVPVGNYNLHKRIKTTINGIQVPISKRSSCISFHNVLKSQMFAYNVLQRILKIKCAILQQNKEVIKLIYNHLRLLYL